MQNLWESIFLCDSYRPLKARPFWCTETSTCWNGGTTAGGGYREPGFCRVNSWLPIALGGEANLYWLWRSHSSGQELMHGSVVSSCGRPLHIFGEVQEIARGFRAAAGFLNETRPVGSTVALHLSTRSWEMSWAQPMVQNFSYNRQLLDVYHLLLQLQLRPDVIHPAAALDAYRVIVSPCLTMLDEGGLRERLRTWIEAGGTWVAGPLTDVRTIEASKFTHAPFGTLEEWAGVYCKYDIPADPRGFSMRWADGTESKGSIWHSGFELRGAKALATYTENELAGLAAVTCRRMGKGRVIALGTMLPPEEMMRLLQRLTSEAGIAPVATASTHVLVAPRTGAAEGMVVVEHEHKPGSLTLPRPMTDLLTGKRHEGVVALEPYAVMVLKA
jgi:beta-galactosidase GanA